MYFQVFGVPALACWRFVGRATVISFAIHHWRRTPSNKRLQRTPPILSLGLQKLAWKKSGALCDAFVTLCDGFCDGSNLNSAPNLPRCDGCDGSKGGVKG